MDKWVHAFRKCIIPKVNIIARLEFELTDLEAIILLLCQMVGWLVSWLEFMAYLPL